MKQRKVFLEGFVELKRELFKTPKSGYKQPVVTILENRGALRFSTIAIQNADFNFEGNSVACSVFTNGKDFAITEDSEGVAFIKRYKTANSSNYTLCSIDLVRLMLEKGYEQKRHYRVTSPEKGAMIIHQD